MNNEETKSWLYSVGGKISNFGTLFASELEVKSAVYWEVLNNMKKAAINKPNIKKFIVAAEIYRKANNLYFEYCRVHLVLDDKYIGIDAKEREKKYEETVLIYEKIQNKAISEIDQLLKENNLTFKVIKEAVEKVSLFIDEVYVRYSCNGRGKDVALFVENLVSGDKGLKKSATKR